MMRFLYMCSAQDANKTVECDVGPKQSEIIACKFWVIYTASIMVEGNVSSCFILSCLILSANAKLRSRSKSFEFIEDISGQKNMLTPDGRSGVIHKKSQFQRQAVR
jgi:hypothetical protein